MNKEEFQRRVLDASFKQPVLVDFWAPWCGPCRVLGPVLDSLAANSQGRWKLVKVNTDEAPDISADYGIRGIPAVKLFVKGKVEGEFTGALGEPAVRKWLDEHLPSPGRMLLRKAEAFLEEGRTGSAVPHLKRALEMDPENARTRIRLAQALALTQPEDAAAPLNGLVPDPEFAPVVNAVNTLHRYHQISCDTLPDGEGRAAYTAAILALAKQDHETAIRHLIEVLKHDRYYDDDGARKLGVALFTLLGPRHPISRSQRRLFDMWLY